MTNKTIYISDLDIRDLEHANDLHSTFDHPQINAYGKLVQRGWIVPDFDNSVLDTHDGFAAPTQFDEAERYVEHIFPRHPKSNRVVRTHKLVSFQLTALGQLVLAAKRQPMNGSARWFEIEIEA